MTSIWGEDGTEYAGAVYDFRCRFHRAKRPKNTTVESLEGTTVVYDAARALAAKSVVQFQHVNGDVMGGVVVENRITEQSLVVDILPRGSVNACFVLSTDSLTVSSERVEVDWKYVLALDPSDSQIVPPSVDAKPLPAHFSKETVQARGLEFGPPKADDMFSDADSVHKWAEFSAGPQLHNKAQVKVDLDRVLQLWHYLGRYSTDAKAQYTHDLALRRHNPLSNFLDTVKPATAQDSFSGRRSSTSVQPSAGGLAKKLGKKSLILHPPRANQHQAPSILTMSTQGDAPVIKQEYIDDHKPTIAPTYTSDWSQPAPRRASGQAAVDLLGRRQSGSHALPGLNSILNDSSGMMSWAESVRQQQDHRQSPAPMAKMGSSHGSNQAPYSSNWSPSRDNTPTYDPSRVPSSHSVSMPRSIYSEPSLVSTSITAPDPEIKQEPGLGVGSSEQAYAARITSYPYLRNAYARRPQVYVSPYHSDGSYAREYAPRPQQYSLPPLPGLPSMNSHPSHLQQHYPPQHYHQPQPYYSTPHQQRHSPYGAHHAPMPLPRHASITMNPTSPEPAITYPNQAQESHAQMHAHTHGRPRGMTNPDQDVFLPTLGGDEGAGERIGRRVGDFSLY
ncbi:hypothetical protein MRB53_038987 [Persea americana]|nr:hypothetical protein MRB53_038987 [Persea americana]